MDSAKREQIISAKLGTLTAELIKAQSRRSEAQARYAQLKDGRYESFNSGPGSDFEAGALSLADLRDHAASTPEPALVSGKQELLENIMNDHMFGAV